MNRVEKGAWELVMHEDFHGYQYLYVVEVNGQMNTALDPYGYGSIENSKRSVVIDFNRIKIEMNDDCLPRLKDPTNAVIGEVSVRDFSMDPDTDIVHKGKFLGMIEEGRTDRDGNRLGLII